MASTDRAPTAAARNRAVPIEALEDRVFLSGSPGGGGDDDDRRGRLSINISQVSTVADLNADGKADLVTVEKIGIGRLTASTVVVNLGRGDGRFVATSARILLADPSAVVVGDFNHDGKADVALVSGGTQTQVHILKGDGTGRIGAPVAMAVGQLPVANVVAGDINGDGYSDLLSFDATKVYKSFNNGAGKLLPAVQQSNPFGGATPVAAGDIDGDGRPELIGVAGDQILFNRATAADGIYIQTTLPTFGSDLSLAGKRLLVADVDGDGQSDLVAVGDGSVSVALQSGFPVVTDFLPWVTTTVAGVDPARTLVGDVDGDGQADLLQPKGSFSLVSLAKLVLVSNGDGTFHELLF